MCFDLAHIDVEDKVIKDQEVLFFIWVCTVSVRVDKQYNFDSPSDIG